MQVAGSNPIAGSRLRFEEVEEGQGRSVFKFLFELGQVAEWLMAADCKSAALRATEVRILPCPPITGRGITERGTREAGVTQG